MNRKGRKALRAGSASLLLAALALILLPAQAYADGADVTDEATLVQAVTEGKSPIRLAAGIETGISLSIPAGTVVDLNGCTWTVTSGTVAIAGTVEVNGGELLSANGGTVRVLTALALENVSGTETIQSVTYADGVTDSAASYGGLRDQGQGRAAGDHQCRNLSHWKQHGPAFAGIFDPVQP